MTHFDPCSIDDLLKAHKTLMQKLTNESGRFRSGGVGVFAGGRLVQMAPPSDLVPKLMGDLLHWLKHAYTHPLIKSCIFHYEFEFIHCIQPLAQKMITAGKSRACPITRRVVVLWDMFVALSCLAGESCAIRV